MCGASNFLGNAFRWPNVGGGPPREILYKHLPQISRQIPANLNTSDKSQQRQTVQTVRYKKWHCPKCFDSDSGSTTPFHLLFYIVVLAKGLKNESCLRLKSKEILMLDYSRSTSHQQSRINKRFWSQQQLLSITRLTNDVIFFRFFGTGSFDCSKNPKEAWH